jgi:acetolactate synthase-1/3 small subunit
MNRVFQIIVDNTSGVLSRISGLFSRRGYNIESITAGVTADPRFTRITIVASGDEGILEQIEKQVSKLVDVRDVKELKPEDSVYRELAMIKVSANAKQRQDIIALADIFRGSIIDVAKESLMVEIVGSQDKIDAFINLLDGYEILELARTGIAALARGTEHVLFIDEEGNVSGWTEYEKKRRQNEVKEKKTRS